MTREINSNINQTVKGEVFCFKDLASEAPTIRFHGHEGMEIMRLEPNGDIYVKGKLIENDKQITEGLREFIRINWQ